MAKPQESEPKKLSEKASPKSEAPAKDRSIPFNRWDTNKDEFLALEEYKAGQKDGSNLEARYKRFDKDGDGRVSRKEFVTPSAK
mgnify:CR=1 FL=1